ncbi:hypothetical protein ACOMHN_043005 [Nucella lapillus]
MAILDPSLWYTPCWCVLLVITSFVWATSSDPPSDPRNIATHSATKDHHGGIPMGVVAGCDDAESNIEVDWNLRSTMEYTCEGNILKPNGAIVAMYHPCADPGEVERLRGMVRGCLRRHVITPYPHLPPPHPLRPVVLGMQATDEPRSDLCRAQLNSVHISVSVMLYMYYVLLFGGKGKGSLPPVSSGRPVLLITAHPDDECMFFSPFILSTTRHGPGYQPAAVHVLCLTNGNYYGQGKVREKEIIKSCEILGIPADHVSVINNSRLPDDPKAVWDTSTLESQLFAAVNRVQPQHIVTFDNCGVSGHGNHITVSKAIRSIFQGGNSFKGVESVYYLESISLWRKYLGILDLPFTYLYSSHICLLSPANILRGQRAMLAHWSQLEWFRGLYIMLSRYMIVNSFTMEHRTQHWPNDR